MKTKAVSPYISGLAMAGIFGLSFLFSKQGLEYMSPMTLLSCRFGIAAIVLTILWLFGVVKVNFRKKPIGNVVILSIFYPVISFLFETAGLQWTSSSQAGIMVSLMPVFVAFLGTVILKERQNKMQILCIFSSVAGVLITVVFAQQGAGGTKRGLLLLLCSVLAGSVYNILSRKNAAIFTPVEITFMMIWSGAIIFTIVSFVQAQRGIGILSTYIAVFTQAKAFAAVAYLGILASVVAFFCMNHMLGKLPAANACIFNNLATVISIFAGVIVLQEKLYWYQIIGGIFIIAGVWGTNYYEGRGE